MAEHPFRIFQAPPSASRIHAQEDDLQLCRLDYWGACHLAVTDLCPWQSAYASLNPGSTLDDFRDPMLLDYDMAFSNHVYFDIDDDDWQYPNHPDDKPFISFYEHGLVEGYRDIVDRGLEMWEMHRHWIWPDGMDVEPLDDELQRADDNDLDIPPPDHDELPVPTPSMEERQQRADRVARDPGIVPEPIRAQLIFQAPDAAYQQQHRAPRRLPELVFEPAEPPVPPSQAYQKSSPFFAVRFAMLLVLWLQTCQQLSFVSLAILLFVLRLFFKVAEVIDREDDLPASFSTILKRFQLLDRFQVYPICQSCHRFYPKDSPPDQTCSDCPDIPIFRQSSGKSPAYLVAAYQPLSDLLLDFLLQEGIVESLETWRGDISEDCILRTIMDGRLWKEIKGPDGLPFFAHREDDELRIGVTLSMDW